VKSLHVRVKVFVLGQGSAPGGFVQGRPSAGYVRDRSVGRLFPVPGPCCLDGCAECRAFGLGGADHFDLKDIGHDLSPDRAVTATAGQPDFRWGDPKVPLIVE